MKEKKSLLIVDDDIAHRTMLRILLDWQYEVTEADNGAMAIANVSQRNYDVILMDIRMPGLSGIEALDQIKSMRPGLPIVMMTAYFTEETAALVRDRGASNCLGKPFDFDNLRHIIEGAIAS